MKNIIRLAGILYQLLIVAHCFVQQVAQKVSHYQESSLNRTTNSQRGDFSSILSIK